MESMYDEVIVGVEQMRIADDIVCYSIAISDCAKEPHSLMALTLFKQTDQCSMFKTRLCSIQRSVHVEKACFGPCYHICCIRCKTEN